MPPKKTSQKKTPRFTAKLNPVQQMKKELKQELKTELKMEKDDKKVLKNLLIKNVEIDVDEEEEEKIRLFITSLNKKKLDVFEKEIRNFIYDNPTKSRTDLFEKINENLSDKEKKLLFIRYLNQEEMPLEIVYNDFISTIRQDEIIRNFLQGLNKIYSDSEEEIKKNIDDKKKIKQIKTERKDEIFEKINKFQRQKNVLPATSEIFDMIKDNLPANKLYKLIQSYLKQHSLTFKQFYNKFLEEDYEELEIKEFFSDKAFENTLRYKTKEDVLLKIKELLDKDPEKKELENIFQSLDIYLIRRLVRTYLDQFYDDPKDRVSFTIFVERFLEDKYVKMYEDRQKTLELLLEQKQAEDAIRKQREIDLLFEEGPVVTVDLIDITPNTKYISILNGPVTKDIKDHGAKLLSENLLKVSNMRLEYDIDSEYIFDVVNIAENTSKNALEFITKIGNIIVYLLPGLSKYEVYVDASHVVLKSNDIFIKNLLNIFYEPSVLLNLTPEEKLPEIFKNDRVSEKRKSDTLYNLNVRLKYFILNFVDYIYRFRNMFIRTDYTGSFPTLQDIDTIKEESYPFELDIIQFENDNVIYYDPTLNMTFMFKVEDVLDQIENNDYINKISRTQFHPDFIKNIRFMYNQHKKRQEDYNIMLKEEKNMIKYFDPDLKKVLKFSKPNLWRQFEDGNYINEITGKPFDPDFIRELQNLRSILLEREKEEADILKARLRKEEIKEKVTKYSIIDDLFDDLEQMENL